MSRNIILLSICQALYMSVVAVFVITAPLIGLFLASRNELATVPIGILDTSMLLTAYLASILMARIGRRSGLIIGALLGMCGAAMVIVALSAQSFVLFCIGSIGLGSYFAYAQYYRFAAAEMCDQTHSSQAISYVLAGGLAAAFIGPFITNYTRDTFVVDYAGNYLAIIVFCFMTVLILLKLEVPEQTSDARQAKSPARSLARPGKGLMHNRWFLVAIIGAVVSYGVMSLIMTATPLSMSNHGHHFSHTADVMQWHFIGMFAPSFFTGSLIKKYGVNAVMLTGGGILILSSIAGLTGIAMHHYVLSLLLLGVGWNFLFIGASSLLSDAIKDESQKSRAQGLNETFVSATMVVTSFTSGAMYEFYGWKTIHYMSITIVVTAMVVMLAVALLESRKGLFKSSDLRQKGISRRVNASSMMSE